MDRLAAAQDMSKGDDVGFTRTSDVWSPFVWEEAVNFKVPILTYLASKTFAEKAAWDFVESEKPSFTMSTIVPPIILGPALQPVESLKDLNLSAAAVWNIIDAEEVPATAVPVSWRGLCAIAELRSRFGCRSSSTCSTSPGLTTKLLREECLTATSSLAGRTPTPRLPGFSRCAEQPLSPC